MEKEKTKKKLIKHHFFIMTFAGQKILLSVFSLFAVISSGLVSAQETGSNSCSLDIERLNFDGINATCSKPNAENLCIDCPLDIIQRIVDAGYNLEDVETLQISRCFLTYLPNLLQNGVTLLALMKLQTYDIDLGDSVEDILSRVKLLAPAPAPPLPTDWLRNSSDIPASPNQADEQSGGIQAMCGPAPSENRDEGNLQVEQQN